jgi:hypothetical protein
MFSTIIIYHSLLSTYHQKQVQVKSSMCHTHKHSAKMGFVTVIFNGLGIL